MSNTPPKRRTGSFLGMAIFFLLVIWALWHGVIGPRVIDPIPGDQELAREPDPERAPPLQ